MKPLQRVIPSCRGGQLARKSVVVSSRVTRPLLVAVQFGPRPLSRLHRNRPDRLHLTDARELPSMVDHQAPSSFRRHHTHGFDMYGGHCSACVRVLCVRRLHGAVQPTNAEPLRRMRRTIVVSPSHNTLGRGLKSGKNRESAIHLWRIELVLDMWPQNSNATQRAGRMGDVLNPGFAYALSQSLIVCKTLHSLPRVGVQARAN